MCAVMAYSSLLDLRHRRFLASNVGQFSCLNSPTRYYSFHHGDTFCARKIQLFNTMTNESIGHKTWNIYWLQSGMNGVWRFRSLGLERSYGDWGTVWDMAYKRRVDSHFELYTLFKLINKTSLLNQDWRLFRVTSPWVYIVSIVLCTIRATNHVTPNIQAIQNYSLVYIYIY